MKAPNLSLKRRPARQTVFRRLYANVRRKKQSASVAAPAGDVEGDVPNLGIARALIVILIIHVVAVAGIFAHSRWFEEETVSAAGQTVIEPIRPLRNADASLPIVTTEDSYRPVAGDTYRKIAISLGVDEQELRHLNENTEIAPGRYLRVPIRTVVAEEPPELAALRQGSAVIDSADALPNEEAAPPPTPVRIDEIRNAPMVETAAANSSVVVKPRVNRTDVASTSSTTVATAPAATPAPPATAMKRKYTAKAGDTFWKIARAHGTTPEVIMKANGISDPRKLRVGMQLSVP